MNPTRGNIFDPKYIKRFHEINESCSQIRWGRDVFALPKTRMEPHSRGRRDISFYTAWGWPITSKQSNVKGQYSLQGIFGGFHVSLAGRNTGRIKMQADGSTFQG